MPSLPAICDTCGRLWIPNAVFLGNAIADIKDFTVSPCPYCGQTGHIPDGIYDTTAEGIRIIANSARSASSLAILQRLLEEARASNSSPEATAAVIERESPPEFRLLAEVVRRLKGVPIATWLTLLLAAITIIQGESFDQRLNDVQGKVDRIYRQAVEVIAEPSPTPSSAPMPRVGRNDPCPCGSGRKYKRCHGR